MVQNTIRFPDDDDLYEEIGALAHADRRSINAEVLTLLREAVEARRMPRGVQLGDYNTQINRF